MTLNNENPSTYRQTSRASNTADLEVMYSDLGYDFKINELSCDGDVDIAFRASPLDSIRVIRSTYTPSYYVMDKEDTDQGFQVFHKGSGLSIVNGTEIPLSRQHATFHSGHQRMERHDATHGDTTYIMWDERDLLRFVSNHLGREVTTPVKFDALFDFNSPMGAQIQHMLKFLEQDIIHEADDLNMALVKAHTDNMFFALLLSAQKSNYRDVLMAPQSPALPSHVKRVRDYLNANSHLPITMADLVTISGVSGSSLHAGFRRYLDITPMAYLKGVRLDRVHEELCNGEPGESVSSIARRWGFTNLGRFAHDYASRYNITPSKTLST